jgi:hypothetical protein
MTPAKGFGQDLLTIDYSCLQIGLRTLLASVFPAFIMFFTSYTLYVTAKTKLKLRDITRYNKEY